MIKEIRDILSNVCLSDFTDKCKNDGACEKCEDEALEKLIAEHDAKIRADAITRDYNTILIYENTIRSMLLNTSQENNLIEWVDLNGKLNAITHIKHLIYDLEQLKEQK